MASTSQVVIEHLEGIGVDSIDHRVLEDRDYKILAWFFHYGQNVFSQYGLDWEGVSFRQRGEWCNVAVKATKDDTPLVAFATDRTPMGCMRVIFRKWHEGRLEWYPDRYR